MLGDILHRRMAFLAIKTSPLESVKICIFFRRVTVINSFFCKKKKRKLSRKKGFYWQSKHTIKKVAKFGILSKGLVDGFVENSKFFHSLFSSKKGQEKVFVADPKKTFFIDNKPL